MAITIMFALKNPKGWDGINLHETAESILFNTRGMIWCAYSPTRTIKVANGCFQITFDGIMIVSDVEKISNFIMHQLSYLLYKLGIGIFFAITSIEAKGAASDKAIDLALLLPRSLGGEKLLEAHRNMGEIPKKFLCSLTQQMMHNPISLKQRPEHYYEKSALFYWVFQKDGFPKNPYTTLPFHYEDIVEEHALEEEIRGYIKSTIQRSIQIKILIEEYKLPDNSEGSLQQGLRRAAARKNHADLLFFIENMPKMKINSQDDNPKSHRSALHWAVINQHPPCIKTLLSYGADENLKDALAKSAFDYAVEAKQPDILACFNEATQLRIDHTRFFAKQEGNLAENALNIIADYLGQKPQ